MGIGDPDFRETLRRETEILLQQQAVLDRLDDLNEVVGMLDAIGIDAVVGSTFIVAEGRHALTLCLRVTEAQKLKTLVMNESLRRFGGTDAED